FPSAVFSLEQTEYNRPRPDIFIPDMTQHHSEEKSTLNFPERNWIALTSSQDIETWIDHYNRDLQRALGEPAEGSGLCFRLTEGGEIFLHTTADGAILLDVTPEAEWVTPAIAAATGSAPPAGRIWALPGHVLTQLILGLSSLIATTRMVASHDFHGKKSW